MSRRCPGAGARPCVAVVAALLVAASVSAAEETASVRAMPLTILLTISSKLSPLSQRTMLAEASRIWSREQVALQWERPAAGSPDPSVPLRALVIERMPLSPDAERWPVGELVTPRGYRALAIASITGARRVVDEATQYRLLDGMPLADNRVGLVLGRALAHEIGHFLLATPTHADRGLMRATIESREFAAPGADTFALDGEARQWLEGYVRASASAVDMRAAGFSYATR